MQKEECRMKKHDGETVSAFFILPSAFPPMVAMM